MHLLRSAYGYTDEQILDHIRKYGQPWINEAIEFINEDKKEKLESRINFLQWLMNLMPLARTPMDKSGGTAIQNYSKSIQRALENSLPWIKERRDAEIRRRLKEPPQNVKPKVID